MRCRVYDADCINDAYCRERDACCAGDMDCKPVVKLTKQGVRDLGGQRAPRRRFVPRCPHVWERTTVTDCWNERTFVVERCGMCHDQRGIY